MNRLQTFARDRLFKRDQDGEFVIETIVAIFLLAIALSMSLVIVTVLTKNVARTTNTGTSADAVQSALQTLESYVSGVDSPIGGAEAELQPQQISNICWGSSPVSAEEASTDLANGWTGSNYNASVNQTLGIIYARDFSMIYCGYGADEYGAATMAPSLYEIYVNTSTPGSCTNTNINSDNDYCLLQIVDLSYTASGSPTSYTTSDYPDLSTSQVPPALPPVQSLVVSTIGRVWCDAACRQLGISCSSMANAQINGLTVPSNYSTLCPSGYSGTPPLFNYYTSAGVGSTSNGSLTNPSMNWLNAYINSQSTPQNVNTSSSITTTCLNLSNPTATLTPQELASCGPLDMYSPADAQSLQEIQCILLNITVLGANNPSSTSAKSTSVTMSDQVWLRNLST
jgi:hypothetical protein